MKNFLGSGQQRDFYYVAQDNLEVIECVDNTKNKPEYVAMDDNNSTVKYGDVQTDHLLERIKNRELKIIRNFNMERHFDEFNENTGCYDAKDLIKFCFSLLPNSPDSLLLSGDQDKEKHFEDCEKILLALYSILNQNFLKFQATSYEELLLTLLKNACTRY